MKSSGVSVAHEYSPIHLNRVSKKIPFGLIQMGRDDPTPFSYSERINTYINKLQNPFLGSILN